MSVKYLFGLMEKDFLPDRHCPTGLWDVNGHPIIKLDPVDPEMWPMGFGKHEEWNEIASRNSG